MFTSSTTLTKTLTQHFYKTRPIKRLYSALVETQSDQDKRR